MRWLLNFTVRDSPEDFINVSCWGGGAFINDLAKSFRLGDLGLSSFFTGLSSFFTGLSPGGVTLEKDDGDVPARTKFYDPVLE